MYQDLIRNELNEAAETLANFLKDDANIHAIQRAAVLLADSFKAVAKCSPAVTAALTVTRCTSQKS
jgi:D-sedoheptulose 7-phosphate isomerase